MTTLRTILALALGLTLSVAAANAQTTTWRLQTFVPETDGDYYITLAGVAKTVAQASGGKIAIKPFPVGTLVGPGEIVDSVANGAIEAGHIIGGMAAGRAPSALGSHMSFGVMSYQQAHDVHWKHGLIDIMREEYRNNGIFLLTVATPGQVHFMGRKAIRSVADFKGMKVWAAPPTLWLSEFGASPTQVPDFDMYSALRLGTIDGLTWTMNELDKGNFKEVVKYVIEPRLYTPGGHVIVNLQAWNKLDGATQTALMDATREAHLEISAQYAASDLVARKAAADYGVEFIQLSEAETAKLRDAARATWNEIATLSPAAQKMVEIYRAYLKSVGL